MEYVLQWKYMMLCIFYMKKKVLVYILIKFEFEQVFWMFDTSIFYFFFVINILKYKRINNTSNIVAESFLFVRKFYIFAVKIFVKLYRIEKKRFILRLCKIFCTHPSQNSRQPRKHESILPHFYIPTVFVNESDYMFVIIESCSLV